MSQTHIPLRGNNYIMSFVDWLTKWVDVYVVMDKTAQTMARLIVNEIFPSVAAVAELVTNNGGEFVSVVMRETLKSLNVNHITTSRIIPIVIAIP